MSCPVITGVDIGHLGKIEKFGSTRLYVTGPATAKVGVLAFTDIYGFDSGRVKADADSVGSLGYAVALVDLVDGDFLDADSKESDVLDWVRAHPFDTELATHIEDAVRYLKVEAQVKQIASYGYGWGAWVGATLTTKDDSEVRAHVSFSPSWKFEELLHGAGAVEKLASAVKAPQLLLSSRDEATDVFQDNGPIHKILAARGGDIGTQSQVVEFAHLPHGWIECGDLEDAETKDGVMKAWHLAVQFLQQIAPQV